MVSLQKKEEYIESLRNYVIMHHNRRIERF